MRRLLLLFFPLLLLFGCTPEGSVYPDKISPQGENFLCTPPLTNLTLRYLVEGPEEPGLLGGKGQRRPAHNVIVSLAQLENDPEITFPNGNVCTSDFGGAVSFKVRIGKTVGDRHLFASADSPFGIVGCETRIVSGVECKNTRQEILAGNSGDEILSLRLFRPDGAPLTNAPVHFSIDPFLGCRLSATDIKTDAEGFCGTRITAGKATGETEVIAEIDLPGFANLRGLHFNSVVINLTNVIIAILGGLALFLLGMTMMSEGLQSVAGARLKSILQLFVRNRFTGILVGAIITAIVQSSSATSVMVVGFVNAGLMSLEQAISVIFGSCIGTTLTTQIIAFGLSGIALPAVLLGVIIRLAGRKATTKYWGDVIMGFGLLFFGMDMMSKTLVPLRTSPTFVAVFRSFDCSPIDGVMPFWHVLAAVGIGLVATMIVQSSAATIGVVMALAGSGLINFYTAFPLVLGDNIGTTITANLAALGTNRKARRAALVNTIIKVGGTFVMLPLFYVYYKGEPIFLYFINAITSGEVLGGKNENIIRHIAMSHTLFNIVTVVLLCPFVKQLAWLCEKIIPVKEEKVEEEHALLDERLLRTPALALSQIVFELIQMTKRGAKMVDDSYLCLCEGSVRFLARVMKREESINFQHRRIDAYISALAGHNLNDDEIALLPDLMHISHDIERIGDLAVNLSELAQRRFDQNIKLSDSAIKELSEIDDLLQNQFAAVVSALEQGDREEAGRAIALEQEINSLHRSLTANHMKRLEAGNCSPKACVLFLDAIGNIERIGDHLLNIAQRVEIIIPYIVKVKNEKSAGDAVK